ncbi:3-hydroxy-9,10-secoandrosta-1,3,5(10)-triene-9,17-dione monooxygenase reductase subunit [Pseudonocardia sp. CA-107938]|uniref:3-hydroxy-9,10-secoandrosta-1,3,5(10)-triene-9, 17-dione monooxygenase reductase subunit n=1 Tax=Pseudonocardia sp. CA-107938 TaxID=3240021 RepID=UPI003D91600D
MTRALVDPDRFRTVLGHFATGVTVVTGCADGVPVGFACQAFAALSLDPPLVLFCPGRSSQTWPVISRSGRFCVNVLSARQQDLSRRFGSRGADKFAGVSWTPSPGGAPVLDGVLSWVDAEIETVHSGGDHHVVVGRVTDLDARDGDRPLLFYRGGYTVTEVVAPPPTPAGEVLESFLTWPQHDNWL